MEPPTPSPIQPTLLPTSQPIVSPVMQPTTAPHIPILCGCQDCTVEKWNTYAGDYTCGSRIESLLLTYPNDYPSDEDACRQVSHIEFPSICGPYCDPDLCDQNISPTKAPKSPLTASPTDSPIESTSSPVLSTVSPIETPNTSPTTAFPFTSKPVRELDGWMPIFYDGFEVGIGLTSYFKNIGSKITTEMKHLGLASISLKKKHVLKSEKQEIREYSEVKVDFWFYSNGMEVGDVFSLEVLIFPGSRIWVEAKKWTAGEDFDNHKWYMGSVVVPVDGKNKMIFRFRGQCDEGSKVFFIDDVTFSGKHEQG